VVLAELEGNGRCKVCFNYTVSEKKTTSGELYSVADWPTEVEAAHKDRVLVYEHSNFVKPALIDVEACDLKDPFRPDECKFAKVLFLVYPALVLVG
jgi:hypothetical protein